MTGTASMPLQQGQPGQDLGARIRQDVQRAVEEAQREAALARQEAARAAQEANGVRIEQGQAIRVDEQGRIIPFEAGDGEIAAVAVQPPPPLPPIMPGLPDGVVAVSIAFFVMLAVIIVGWPIARALSRRMDRNGVASPGLPAEQAERIARIEQAVDAMAIEVERISEGQRFVTKLLTDRALPDGQHAAGDRAPAAEALPVGGERR